MSLVLESHRRRGLCLWGDAIVVDVVAEKVEFRDAKCALVRIDDNAVLC